MVQSPTKVEIAERLREQIASGALPLGARISDKEIAAALGVSRTPVREALLALEAAGLVTLRRQSGTFVFRPDPAEIASLCAFRAIIEAGAIGLAPDLPGLGATLVAHCDAAAAALARGDHAACEAADTAFHAAVVAASENRDLIAAHRGIADRVRALRHTLPQTEARIGAAISAHRAIAAALAAADREGAAALLARHVEGVAVLLGASPRP
ncbi:MAG: GntR family transcriptional regulator [Acetobacteraceae bacterium]|jgi:DNA-binding GntR family transcriptional regulator|nr:GntR family transcriptional regulator [Acetobacteraceae bacterium]